MIRILLSFPLVGILLPISLGQTAEFTTTPVGFNKVVCISDGTTSVSIPFVRQAGSLHAKVSVKTSPAAAPDRVEFSVAGNVAWTVGQFANTHYVRFITGSRAGQWYDVVGSGTNQLTLDAAGDDLFENVAAGDLFLLAPHWTLDSLFPPPIRMADPMR